ncbi:hypothetical protein BH24CHL7_BH24CHL7_16100 [soil metagenome]
MRAGRGRVARSIAMLVGLSLLVAACAPAAVLDPSPSATATIAAPAASEGARPSPRRTLSDDDFGRLIGAVAGNGGTAGELDELWREIITESHPNGDPSYRSPDRVVAFYGGQEVPPTECAIGLGIADWRQNARYCPADGTIAYDELWLREFSTSAGDFAPAAILAHEWGHHVQHLLGQQIFAELQADCFAGMYLGASEHVVDDVYELRDAQLDAALTAFFSIGNRDYEQAEWFQVSNTGSRHQRLLAFSTGYLGALGDFGDFGSLINGYPWCYGYADFRPGDFATVGPYRLINFPGRRGEWQDSTYVIPAETRTAYGTSGMRLQWLDHILPGTQATPELLLEIARGDMPGVQLLYPLEFNVANGVARYYERRGSGTGGSEDVESGIVAVALPASTAGALLIVIQRPEAAPTDPPDRADLALVAEQVTALNHLLSRLCGPDDSANPADPALSAACVEEH